LSLYRNILQQWMTCSLMSLYILQGLDVNWICPTAQSRSLLHLSVLHENIECIELLVQHGANVNVKDQNNNTPLHIAAQKVFFFVFSFSSSSIL
jgi:ankyrin repeat protein